MRNFWKIFTTINELFTCLEKATDQCVKEGLITEDQAEQLKDTLQLPHIHQYQKLYMQETDFGDRKHCRQCCKKGSNKNEEGSEHSGSETDREHDHSN